MLFRETLTLLSPPVCLTAQPALPIGPGQASDSLNDKLPSWLRLEGEERVRFESLTGVGLRPVSDRYLWNRLRLLLEIQPSDWLKFSIEAQDSRVFG